MGCIVPHHAENIVCIQSRVLACVSLMKRPFSAWRRAVGVGGEAEGGSAGISLECFLSVLLNLGALTRLLASLSVACSVTSRSAHSLLSCIHRVFRLSGCAEVS